MIRFSVGICKGCGRPIIWFQTPAKKSMPCDPDEQAFRENPSGKDTIVKRNGEVVKAEIIARCSDLHVPGEKFTDLGDADGIGYVPHWATCPNADQFRRKKHDKP